MLDKHKTRNLTQSLFTVSVNSGELIETINYFVKSGDVACDAQQEFTTNINANCGASCDAEAGVVSVEKNEFCLDENVVFTASGNNSSEGYVQRYVLTSGTDFIIESISESESFSDLPAGEYCIHAFNFLESNALEIPSVGESAALLLDQTACFDLDPSACFTITVLDCDTIMDGLQELENIDVKAFFNNQSNLQINVESSESLVLNAVLLDVNGKAIREQKFEINNGFNSFEMDCNSLSKGVYVLNMNGEYSVRLFRN